MREDTDCDTHDLLACHCTQNGLLSKPPGIEDYDFDDDRDCQLGDSSTKKNESHKTVDQLMEWQHYGLPFSSGIFEVVVNHILLHKK